MNRYPQSATGKHLLDTESTEKIGSSVDLQPEAGVGGVVTPQTATNGTSYKRILQLNGPSKTAQTTSVIFTASRLVGEKNPNPGYAGPVTGVLVFGNGGRATQVEFDIPVGPFTGIFQGATQATEPQDGGIIISVPTGVVEAYARYDNRFIQPCIGPTPQSIAQMLGVPFIGAGGPVVPPAPPQYVAPAEPVLVKAMSAFYTRHFSRAYKTQFCYVGQIGQPGIPLPGGNVAWYTIPAFAQTVQVKRWPTSAALEVFLWNGLYPAPDDHYSVASEQSPVIPIAGHEHIISVQSKDPNVDLVTNLALVYEVGV